MRAIKQILVFILAIINANSATAKQYESLDKYNLKITSLKYEFKVGNDLNNLFEKYESKELYHKLQQYVVEQNSKVVIDYISTPIHEKALYMIVRRSESGYSLINLTREEERSELIKFFKSHVKK
ncbi:hypothetical protein [Thalassotalea marina]|uniref:Uncharacterized protein n=1 Tax=Thalassotalea marina TaxID=1673741 RepID=A0A919BHU4_9GAMM|nr:hypothetical protein [Thalassotalea marina]GHF92240.1 hypothetical protein GCM10017161_20400 [Thalassotalea marina]